MANTVTITQSTSQQVFTSSVLPDAVLTRSQIGTTAGTVAAGDDARITGAVQSSRIGAANGVASLDSGSHVPMAQVPDLTGTYALIASLFAPRAYHLDALNSFFGGGGWVAGQGTTATSLTAPVSAGASVLPVASATGIIAGQQLLVSEGTAQQAIYTVQSVAALNVTIVGTVTFALTSGATVTPLWTNSSHLTTAGWTAFAYWIAHSSALSGLGSKKVTLLGDSWFTNGATAYTTQINAVFPSATVVNAGVTGNTSTQMIARFATDVPADSAYVIINEPGVNDVYQGFTPLTIAQNLRTLLALIRGIGAVPIITGAVPLTDYPTRGARLENLLSASVTSEAAPSAAQSPSLSILSFPAANYCTAFGTGTQVDTTGINNTAFGYLAQHSLTTGASNTAMGQSAQGALTTGSSNTAVGVGAQAAQTTASNNTAMGSLAQTAVTTGSKNTAIGNSAQASLTTGAQNTAVGDSAQLPLTTGNNNAVVGQGAQRQITTGSGNTACGQGAQNALTTANFNSALGNNAQLSLTTGTGNVGVGYGAQYSPGNIPANATTTANYQVAVGHQSGQDAAVGSDYTIAIGYQALTGGAGSIALGKSTHAGAPGSGAFGTDSTGAGAASTTQDEIGLGTALHTTRVQGWLRLDRGQTTVGAAGAAAALPATPTKYLSVKDSAGVEYVFPVYTKV